MIARATVAFLAITAAHAQLYVDVNPATEYPEEIEKRYTPELLDQLKTTKDDALLLYTEYSARAGAELKIFSKNISGLVNETLGKVEPWVLNNAPDHCREAFKKRIKKIEYDTHRLSGYSAETHHKFFLGHMIVFRIHLNKSEDYIKKCDKVISTCGTPCESTPKVLKWRNLAKKELNRVRDDLQHSRRSYYDILSHSHKRLLHLRKQATTKAQDVADKFELCAHGG